MREIQSDKARERSAQRCSLAQTALAALANGNQGQALATLSLLIAIVIALYGEGPAAPWAVVFVSALSGFGFASAFHNRELKRTFLSADDGKSGQVRSRISSVDAVFAVADEQISKVQQENEALRIESEKHLERYRILTENLAASVVIRDLSGKIIYANPYTEVLTGYSLSELYAVEQDFFAGNIVAAEDREKYARAQKINSLGEGFNLLYRAYHKTGMEMWFETRSEPVMSDDGEVISFLAVTVDVTRMVRYQKQVEEKNRDLQDFAYMVSHDLKAPIFTIKGMAQALREDLKDKLDPDNNDTLTHIEKAAQTLEKLVASVLEYSRVSAQEAKFEGVSLNAVFENILNDFASQIGAARAEIKIAPELPLIHGDRLKLYQIFSNLIGNAIKFKDPARALTIEVTERKTKLERDVVIEVKDNGLGIPADKLPSIFRPFFRAHRQAQIEGAGIGLACVKRLLEKLGGSVEVQSQAGEGSTFAVTLKRAEVTAQHEIA